MDTKPLPRLPTPHESFADFCREYRDTYDISELVAAFVEVNREEQVPRSYLEEYKEQRQVALDLVLGRDHAQNLIEDYRIEGARPQSDHYKKGWVRRMQVYRVEEWDPSIPSEVTDVISRLTNALLRWYEGDVGVGNFRELLQEYNKDKTQRPTMAFYTGEIPGLRKGTYAVLTYEELHDKKLLAATESNPWAIQSWKSKAFKEWSAGRNGECSYCGNFSDWMGKGLTRWTALCGEHVGAWVDSQNRRTRASKARFYKSVSGYTNADFPDD